MNLKEEIRKLVEEEIKNLGYKLDRIEIGRQRGKRTVTIFIDKDEDYIGIEDCVRVSRAIDPILEEADLIKEEWILIVSSPGKDV